MADSGHKNLSPALRRNEYLKTRRKEKTKPVEVDEEGGGGGGKKKSVSIKV